MIAPPCVTESTVALTVHQTWRIGCCQNGTTRGCQHPRSPLGCLRIARPPVCTRPAGRVGHGSSRALPTVLPSRRGLVDATHGMGARNRTRVPGRNSCRGDGSCSGLFIYPVPTNIAREQYQVLTSSDATTEAVRASVSDLLPSLQKQAAEPLGKVVWGAS